MQPLGHRIVGIDASLTMVRLAATHERPEPSVVADAAGLPFPERARDPAEHRWARIPLFLHMLAVRPPAAA